MRQKPDQVYELCDLCAYMIKFRRLMGIQSEMNVWKKTFTSESYWGELNRVWNSDFKFVMGDRWPGSKIGEVIHIKKPERFVGNRIKR